MAEAVTSLVPMVTKRRVATNTEEGEEACKGVWAAEASTKTEVDLLGDLEVEEAGAAPLVSRKVAKCNRAMRTSLVTRICAVVADKWACEGEVDAGVCRASVRTKLTIKVDLTKNKRSEAVEVVMARTEVAAVVVECKATNNSSAINHKTIGSKAAVISETTCEVAVVVTAVVVCRARNAKTLIAVKTMQAVSSVETVVGSWEEEAVVEAGDGAEALSQ